MPTEADAERNLPHRLVLVIASRASSECGDGTRKQLFSVMSGAVAGANVPNELGSPGLCRSKVHRLCLHAPNVLDLHDLRPR